MMKKAIWGILACLVSAMANAQIGYQVSLLNTATGEPRANVTVNATVTITNSENAIIYTGTQSATSNDFGVLSLIVGNADTFKDVDFSKLPFYIEVSVDGVLIGKSQILSVPVAEAARTLVPTVTKEILCAKTWTMSESDGDGFEASFTMDGKCKLHYFCFIDGQKTRDGNAYNGEYEIMGNSVNLYCEKRGGSIIHINCTLRYYKGNLYMQFR